MSYSAWHENSHDTILGQTQTCCLIQSSSVWWAWNFILCWYEKYLSHFSKARCLYCWKCAWQLIGVRHSYIYRYFMARISYLSRGTCSTCIYSDELICCNINLTFLDTYEFQWFVRTMGRNILNIHHKCRVVLQTSKTSIRHPRAVELQIIVVRGHNMDTFILSFLIYCTNKSLSNFKASVIICSVHTKAMVYPDVIFSDYDMVAWRAVGTDPWREVSRLMFNACWVPNHDFMWMIGNHLNSDKGSVKCETV